jgi:hypothetical protein
VRGGGTLAQDGVSLLGHVFDLHARHGAIMALEAPDRKRAVIGTSGHQVALPTEETGTQVPLICTSRTIAATQRDLRHIVGLCAGHGRLRHL